MDPVPELDRLVVDDRARGVFRVHRAAMTSPEILGLERERVFDRCWLYLGHESEVATPGDYRRRTVNGRPLIFVRRADGELAVYYNSCTHRGAPLCRDDAGNAGHFQCFYHAWTFDNAGNLAALPSEDGYPETFDRAELALRRPPRLESYRGFVFVCYDADVESLVDYLAGATEYLDLVADQSEVGMRIVPGANEYSARANWKLLVENSLDGYHGLPVHQTFQEYQRSIGSVLRRTGITDGRAVDLGNGHAVIEAESQIGRPVAKWDTLFGEDARDDIAAIRRRLVERFGEDRTFRIADTIRNLSIFPNLVINDVAAITVRVFEPTAPDFMNITAWALAPGEETPAQLHRRLDSYLTFLGPGGFATPDDIEVLEQCQIGYRSVRDLEYSDISRGMDRAEPRMIDELQMRAFWRAWHARIEGRPVAPRVTCPETAPAAEPARRSA